MDRIQHVLPKDIEKESFRIITEELGAIELDPLEEPVIKRVIHTTADFDYLDNLCFSKNAIEHFREAIKTGCTIVTDTLMAKSGINKARLAAFGCAIECFMSDGDVAVAAKENRTTRATASVDKAAGLEGDIIYVVGNAPTALIRLRELIDSGKMKPKGIVGAPVGFVNVVAAKELIMETDIPYIVARGRKGGSNVAAAIINAILYNM